MKFGASFPLTASDDVMGIRHFAQSLDQAGFDVLTTAGHLLAVEAGRFAPRPTPTYAGPFHDPFVLFGYLSAITQRLHFRPSILILPLYETAVVAKQAAELQNLSDGRFQMGVGISWNPAEYQAVGQDFAVRGRRMSEQIEVLRKLWSEPYVTFEGRWHHLDGVGLNRLPRVPIPIWIGAHGDERALRRVARLADGLIPLGDPAEPMPQVRQYMAEYGRDPSTLGLSARVVAGAPDLLDSARRLQSQGATYLSIAPPPDKAGQAALDAIIEAKRSLEPVLS